MGEYYRNAEAIAGGHPEHVRTVLPLGFSMVAALLLPSGQGWAVFKVLQCVVGTAAVVFSTLATRAAFGEVAGRIALVVLASHLTWIIYCGIFMPETLHALLLALFLWLAVRAASTDGPRRQLAVGAELVGALFVKGLSAILLPLWGLYQFLRRPPSRPERLVRGGAFLAGAAIAVAVVLGLTSATVGKPVLLASASGLNFVEGKCPEKRHVDSTGMHAQSPLFVQLGQSAERRWTRPFTDARYFFAAGLECVAADPLVIVRSLQYVGFLFAGNVSWPANQTPLRALNRHYERAFNLWILAMGAVGLGVWWRRLLNPEIAPFTLSVVALFLTVWVFKSEMRYRTPFDATFVAFASAGSLEVTRRVKAFRLG